jgi:hypothetical protein
VKRISEPFLLSSLGVSGVRESSSIEEISDCSACDPEAVTVSVFLSPSVFTLNNDVNPEFKPRFCWTLFET